MNVLNIHEDGVFPYQGQNISKSHILPIDFRKKNILKQYRQQFWSSKHANIKFHRYFHHLNSSQALCINLFYPLIIENSIDLFLQYLRISSDANYALFEKESAIEKSGRRTSFDFYIETKSGYQIFVEVKYTEGGFAQAKNDHEHQDKFHNTYLPFVKGSPFLVKECQGENFFLSHYQILRNLIHINNNDFVVLLFPYANSDVREEANCASELLTDSGKEKLKIIYLEEIVTFLKEHCVGTPLGDYFKSFQEKYLPHT